jgi:hypothetical protein
MEESAHNLLKILASREPRSASRELEDMEAVMAKLLHCHKWKRVLTTF